MATKASAPMWAIIPAAIALYYVFKQDLIKSNKE